MGCRCSWPRTRCLRHSGEVAVRGRLCAPLLAAWSRRKHSLLLPNLESQEPHARDALQNHLAGEEGAASAGPGSRDRQSCSRILNEVCRANAVPSWAPAFTASMVRKRLCVHLFHRVGGERLLSHDALAPWPRAGAVSPRGHRPCSLQQPIPACQDPRVTKALSEPGREATVLLVIANP